MVCRSTHSDIQIEFPRIQAYPVFGTQFTPFQRESEDIWWSYANRGVGYVAMSTFVIGEFAVAILERAARFGGGMCETVRRGWRRCKASTSDEEH